MTGPRPRESTFTGLAGGSCGKIDQIDTGYPWQCRITMPGPGRQWAEDREANVGVPKIRFSARGSSLNPLPPENGWALSRLEKCLLGLLLEAKFCRKGVGKIREKCGSPKMVSCSDHQTLHDTVTLMWPILRLKRHDKVETASCGLSGHFLLGTGSQINPNQTSHQVILLLGWTWGGPWSLENLPAQYPFGGFSGVHEWTIHLETQKKHTQEFDVRLDIPNVKKDTRHPKREVF